MAKASKVNNLTEKFRELGLGTRRIASDRFISKDGRFNVRKRGGGMKAFSLYHWLINISWFRFFLFVTAGYLLVNAFFGTIYWLIGVQHLTEFDGQEVDAFAHCFFFSSQTLTTVGFGRISPVSFWSSLVASIEAMIGLLSFAFATGILYGRFSKPKASILFSDKMVVSPYRGIKGLKFRIVNMRDSQLINMEARVMYSFLHREEGEIKRRYQALELEVDFINLFPLPWTIVHPIDEKSPLHSKSLDDLKSERAEFLIILKGHDDTFNQYVHQIHEYNMNEVLFDVDFDPMFDPSTNEETIVHLDKISDCHPI